MDQENALMEFEAAGTPAMTALGASDQSRAIAEVQAALVIAQSRPRDEERAVVRINNSCKRVRLAEQAEYAYKRGGTLVTGPSIRLAEVMARCWGNINYGFREIGRGRDYSEVEAFCHDYETNVRVTRQFQVKHWRDKRGGGAALTEERDKYELVASQAQRRVRACILEIIPGDIVDDAVDSCRMTLKGSIKDIKAEIEKIVAHFDGIGVTVDDIETYLQRSVKSIVPVDIISLRRVYTSIKQGIANRDEFFKKIDKKPAIAKKMDEVFNKEEAPPEKPPAVQIEPEVAAKLEKTFFMEEKEKKAVSPEKSQTAQIVDEVNLTDDSPSGKSDPGATEEESAALKEWRTKVLTLQGEVMGIPPEQAIGKLDNFIVSQYGNIKKDLSEAEVATIKRLHQSIRSEYVKK